MGELILNMGITGLVLFIVFMGVCIYALMKISKDKD